MGRKRSYIPLTVYLNNRHVGQLSRDPSGGLSFGYAQSWLEWQHALPVSLSLPLRKDRYFGAPVQAIFENLLPDYEPLRRRIAQRVGAPGTDAFSLLAEIGRDCVGALQFLPEGEEPGKGTKPTGRPVNNEQIADILGKLDIAPLGIRGDRDFRISIAGAQEKTALLYYNGEWIQPTETTPTTHILKPSIGRLPNGMDLSHSVENEYLCLRLLRQFGLACAHAEIKRFADKTALVVERFDRRWTSDNRLIRLPQEDCCQALSVPPTRKYQNQGGPGVAEIMSLLKASDNPGPDRYDFFKANVLFWLIGATDGHAKNFSLALLPGGRFRMTPLYDVLTAQPSADARELTRKDFRLAMRLGSSNHYRVHDICRHHFVETGTEAGLSQRAVEALLEDVSSRATEAIERTMTDLPSGFPQDLVDSVIRGLHDRLQLLN